MMMRWNQSLLLSPVAAPRPPPAALPLLPPLPVPEPEVLEFDALELELPEEAVLLVMVIPEVEVVTGPAR